MIEYLTTTLIVSIVVNVFLIGTVRFLNKQCKEWDKLTEKQQKMIQELMTDWVKELNKNAKIPYAREVETRELFGPEGQMWEVIHEPSTKTR